ncbi:HIT bis 5'-adenosyl triphosphatase [Tubulinosema ratisbonensis]|uniref:HIT bis 5'-adenosyl triphosphatase n=1 Tax=Tubulinosema ratisbonensis TaxID=291195 RepID=A0A437AHM6_9MICR|nr:HIT bis 5'-adenosyl triphosphatase [Tubulinosema ratisbonensis]
MTKKLSFSLQTINKDLIIYETSKSIAVLHPQPFLKYHVLIFPQSNQNSIDKLRQKELDDLFLTVDKLGRAFDDLGEGFTVLFREHDEILAVHLAVRNPNDLENNDNIYEEGALKMADFANVSDEMKEAALFLRNKIQNVC